MAEKRAANQEEDGPAKKRRKTHYHDFSKKDTKATAHLAPGQKGILVTCEQTKTALAVREMYSLLHEFVEKYYPAEYAAAQNSTEEGAAAAADESIDEALAREMKEMKEKKGLRFTSIDTDLKGSFFIILPDFVAPVEFVIRMLSELKESGVKKTRFTNRLVPVAKTVYASEEEIVQGIAPLLAELGEPTAYRIELSRRCNSSVDRDALIKHLAGTVDKKHKVNLKEPKVVINIDIVKTTACLSILPDYTTLMKYNIRALTDASMREEIRKASEASIKKQENVRGRAPAAGAGGDAVEGSAAPVESAAAAPEEGAGADE